MRRALLALLVLTPLLACRARWRPVGQESATAPEVVELEHESAHGHRDYSASLEAVWEATKESLHAAGIAVPKSARELGEDGGRIAVEAVDVRVTEEAPGAICVRVHFRNVSEAVGVERAVPLLDEIERRLASR